MGGFCEKMKTTGTMHGYRVHYRHLQIIITVCPADTLHKGSQMLKNMMEGTLHVSTGSHMTPLVAHASRRAT